MLDGVGYSFEEGTRVPVQFLFPEIARAVFGGDSIVRGAEEGGGEVSGCLALCSARMEWRSRGGLVDVVAAVAEVVQGGEDAFDSRFGLRGFWVNGLSFLLKGSSVGCWHRDLILSVAPSLLSVSVGVRNALRTFTPLNLCLAGLSRGSGLLESSKSLDLVSSGSCAVAADVSPMQAGSVVMLVSSPCPALGSFDGGSGVVGSALEEGCVVQQQVQLPRRRGRPKKVPPPYQSNPILGCEEQRGDLEEAGASPGSGGPYFTRSKKTWLLGKVLGLEFERSDIEAIRGLEKVYEDHFKT
ncbi:uncharacterized protein LOC130738602 [Lotus japonicus]|uniref:uncharacterized protein LOC130738602 n=1 Tax=Lotus japonicus TaxID=34305 RepID=UPI002585BBEC|nr:uncharacterized protein LOC130738602 [Lotus japonicus]